MSYILGIVVVGLFFVILHYFTELNHTQKIGVTLFFVLIFGGAIYYNSFQNKTREHITSIALKFQQNKKITCNGIDVNQSDYTTSIGTFTFIGKENTKHAGQMFSFDECQ
ncbi:MAG: hypothetical protein U9P71_08700 [Campylobacterota bacterium]|nr:hypothetical protein [Campylobacterota bacterium]